jgi:hypothetical protein
MFDWVYFEVIVQLPLNYAAIERKTQRMQQQQQQQQQKQQ